MCWIWPAAQSSFPIRYPAESVYGRLAYGYMLVWAAFDILILDWVLFPRIKRVRLPGTEDMDKEYRKKWFHVKVMLPAVPVFAVAGVVIAAIMVWIW